MSEEFTFAVKNRDKIEHLKREIFKVFGEVEQPAEDNMISHECEECDAVKNDFAGVNWKDAGGELLERNHDKIPLFSPAAFNYFLPAFLMYVVDNFDSHSTVGEFTIYALAPGKRWNQDDMETYWSERFGLFSDEQMNVIYSFLKLAKENPIYESEFNSVGKKIFERLKAIRAAN